MDIPDQFLTGLRDRERALPAALRLFAEELEGVYETCVRSHQPGIGDNAQLFGLAIWHRLWFALAQRVSEVEGLCIVDANNSHQLQLGMLRLGIHKLGDFVDDDIHASFPDASPTQRSYGVRNNGQLRLFEAVPSPGLPASQAFALRDLTLGHFGNPRDGLLKWHLGAWTLDDAAKPFWAWQARLDADTTDSDPPAITPFDARPIADLEVVPRKRDDKPSPERFDRRA